MISTFTHDDSSPLDQYLLLPDEQFGAASIPLTELRAKASEKGARTTLDTFEYKEDNGVLKSMHIALLNDFVTYMRNTMELVEERPDIRIFITDEQLKLLFDGFPTCFIPALKRLHSSAPNSNMFVLRTTKGPTGKCINFHVDGEAATRTVQIPLNEGYTGGKLVFFVDDKIVAPPRVPGSATIHCRDVLHGVTSVQQGTRNSFFIVSTDKGKAIVEEGVQTLKDSLVIAYNNRVETEALKFSLAKDGMLKQQEEINKLKNRNLDLEAENEQINSRLAELVVDSDELRTRIHTLEQENGEATETLGKLTGSTVGSMNLMELQALNVQLHTTLATVARRELALREEEKKEKECIFCMDKPKNIMLKPCNHVCMCEGCSKNLVTKKCPICNQAFHTMERLYI